MDEILKNKRIHIFNDDRESDKSSPETLLRSFTDSECNSTQKRIKEFSLGKYLHTMRNNGPERIREILRDHIWKAIKKGFLGACFLFNFSDQITANKETVLKFESILRNLFLNSFGFPQTSICLYPSSIEVIDFAELVGQHTGYQVYDFLQTPKLKHNLQYNQTSESGRLGEKFQILDEDPLKSFDYEKSQAMIAKRALSGEISPFFFRKGDTVIGTASDLASYTQLLEEIPLDVFCFHCYRISQSDLSGKKIHSIPRSDVALWIEYSVGDTHLANQIYHAITSSLGDRFRSLERGSRFSQMTLRSSIINLINSRIGYFQSL
ncbi:MAG: hypothetical protein ACXAC8_17795 [Candidatus Hodarchaeales archaeon]